MCQFFGTGGDDAEEGDGVSLRHDTVASRTRVFPRRILSDLKIGQTIRIEYSYTSPIPLKRIEVRLSAIRDGSHPVSLRFIDARVQLSAMPKSEGNIEPEIVFENINVSG